MRIEGALARVVQDKFIPLDCLGVKKEMYLINKYGKIYSLKSHKILLEHLNKDGYKAISLQTNSGGRYKYKVSSLVIYTYTGKPPKDMKDPTINHIDSNRINDYYKNLEWLERGANSSLRKIKPKGEINGQSKLTEEEVIEICEMLQEGKLGLKQIGNIYGVAKGTISNIRIGRAWTHISKDYKFPKRK